MKIKKWIRKSACRESEAGAIFGAEGGRIVGRLVQVGIGLSMLGLVAQLGPISLVNRAVDDIGLVSSLIVVGIGIVYRARQSRRQK